MALCVPAQGEGKAGEVGEEEGEGETHRGQVNKRRTLVAGGESGEERGFDGKRGLKEGQQSQQEKLGKRRAPEKGTTVSVQRRACLSVREKKKLLHEGRDLGTRGQVYGRRESVHMAP